MTAGELINIFRQNNIPNDAILMSDSGWECFATDKVAKRWMRKVKNGNRR